MGLGALTGGVAFLGGLYWVPHSMIFFGGMGKAESYGLLALLVVYLSLYPALFAWLITRARPSSALGRVTLAAGLWISLEWLRSHALSGFPWLSLGYSQYQDAPFLRCSAWGSVYLISFVLVFVSAAIAEAIGQVRERNPAPRGWTSPTSTLGLAVGLAAIAHLVGSVSLPAGSSPSPRIAVVQPNISQDRKWVSDLAPEILRTHLALSERALSYHPDLILWPEASFPWFLTSDLQAAAPLFELVKRSGVPMLVGSGEQEGDRYFNSVYLLTREPPEPPAIAQELGGVWLQRYRKAHLLPFGEYIPGWALAVVPGARQIVERAGAGGFTPGGEQPPLRLPRGAIGPLICFESAFPTNSARFAGEGASLLVNVTNDAWFGETAGPYQHAALLAFRAAENRLPLARCANNGISGFFDASGRMLQASVLDTQDVLFATLVSGPGPLSPFRDGEALGWLTTFGSLAAIVRAFLLGRRSRGPS